MNKPFIPAGYRGHQGAVTNPLYESPIATSLAEDILRSGSVPNKRANCQPVSKIKTNIRRYKHGAQAESSSSSMPVAIRKNIRRSHLKARDGYYWFRTPTHIALFFSGGEVRAQLTLDSNIAIVGSGRHERAAIQSLSQNVDQQVQNLYRCLPMQLSEHEQTVQSWLETLFDLERYRKSRTTETIELAKFARMQNFFRFKCFGGPEIDVDPHQCMGLFDNLADGDWCEIAVRKRLFDSAVETVQLRRLVDEPQPLSVDDVRRELMELPKADFPPLPDGPIQPI